MSNTPRVSVPKMGMNPGAPNPKSKNILIIPTSDIKTFPTRDDKGILLTSVLELNPDAKAIALYATPSTISRFDSGEGDPDAKGVIQNVVFEHPGDSLEVNEFIQNALGDDFIIITTECSGTVGNRLHGTLCNPMQLNFEEQDNNEGIKKTLTFAQPSRGRYKSAHYTGALPAVYDGPSGSGGGGV